MPEGKFVQRIFIFFFIYITGAYRRSENYAFIKVSSHLHLGIFAKYYANGYCLETLMDLKATLKCLLIIFKRLSASIIT